MKIIIANMDTNADYIKNVNAIPNNGDMMCVDDDLVRVHTVVYYPSREYINTHSSYDYPNNEIDAFIWVERLK